MLVVAETPQPNHGDDDDHHHCHHHGIRMAFMGLGKPKRLLRPAGGACEILQEDLALAQGWLKSANPRVLVPVRAKKSSLGHAWHKKEGLSGLMGLSHGPGARALLGLSSRFVDNSGTCSGSVTSAFMPKVRNRLCGKALLRKEY